MLNFVIQFKTLSLLRLFFSVLWSVEVIAVCFGVKSSDFKDFLIVWLHVETSLVHHVAFYSPPPDCCSCCHFLRCLKCFLTLKKKKSFYVFFFFFCPCACLTIIFFCVVKHFPFSFFRSSVLLKSVTSAVYWVTSNVI